MLSLPAGLAADRRDRRPLLIAADVARAVAIGGLVWTILVGRDRLWVIATAAFVEGCGAAVFSAAAVGALRAVVPAAALPEAVAVQTGRQAIVQLIGPALGGALFSLARALPFLADAVSYLFSSASLLAMRTPFQQARSADPSTLRERLAGGFRFLWGQPSCGPAP